MIQLMRWLFLAGTYGFLALFILKNPRIIEKPLGRVTMGVRIHDDPTGPLVEIVLPEIR